MPPGTHVHAATHTHAHSDGNADANTDAHATSPISRQAGKGNRLYQPAGGGRVGPGRAGG